MLACASERRETAPAAHPESIAPESVESSESAHPESVGTSEVAPELAPPPRDFLRALRGACHRNGGVPALIAEVKKASPSKGLLRDHFDPVSIFYHCTGSSYVCTPFSIGRCMLLHGF